MGLLDSVLGAVGGDNPQQGQALQLVMQLVAQTGGISALLDKLQQGGLGSVLQSWLSQGDNLPVSAEQIQSVLGSDLLSQAATKAGVDPQAAGGLLAQYLPNLIDQASPEGRLNTNFDLSQIGSTLLNQLFK